MPIPDPILAAIEAHRDAYATFKRARNATAGARFMSAAYHRRTAARDDFWAAGDALTATPIATMAGVRALVAYAASYDNSDADPAFKSWHLADAMVALDAALTRLARPAALAIAA